MIQNNFSHIDSVSKIIEKNEKSESELKLLQELVKKSIQNANIKIHTSRFNIQSSSQPSLLDLE